MKVRNEEKSRVRFLSSWPMEVGPGKKVVFPSAPFRLSKSEIALANQHALNICTPYGVVWKAMIQFGDKVHLRSVQWKHVISSGILKYTIRDILGPYQRKTLFQLCNLLSELLAEQLDQTQLDVLEYRTHRVLSLL